MKCIVCGCQLEMTNQLDSSLFICPSCGCISDSMGNKKEDISVYLSQIISKYGEEVLEDNFKLNSLLMDYAPSLEKERKLLLSVLREGVLKQLLRIKDDNDSQEQIINRCVYQLTTDLWLNKNAARYAIYALCKSLDIEVAGSISSVEEEKTSISKSSVLCKGTINSNEEIDETLSQYCVIGYKAFAADEGLVKLRVPHNIIEIKSKAFLNCINLEDIEIDSENINIAYDAFEGCCSLRNVSLEKSNRVGVVDNILIDKKEKVAIKAENISGKNQYAVPNGVKRITSKCFDRSEASVIDIPDSVEIIDYDAFYISRNLETINVDMGNKVFKSVDGVVHSKGMEMLFRYPPGKKNSSYYLEDNVRIIGRKAFSFAEFLEEITFTNNLEMISERAFEYCLKIDKIVLPVNVKSIGERAFQYCENLRNVMLSRNIEEIKDSAFLGCEQLETISVPQKVSKIGNFAFSNCKKLKSIIIQQNVSEIGDGAFSDCPDLVIKSKNNDFVERYCYSRGLRFEKI